MKNQILPLKTRKADHISVFDRAFLTNIQTLEEEARLKSPDESAIAKLSRAQAESLISLERDKFTETKVSETEKSKMTESEASKVRKRLSELPPLIKPTQEFLRAILTSLALWLAFFAVVAIEATNGINVVASSGKIVGFLDRSTFEQMLFVGSCFLPMFFLKLGFGCMSEQWQKFTAILCYILLAALTPVVLYLWGSTFTPGGSNPDGMATGQLMMAPISGDVGEQTSDLIEKEPLSIKLFGTLVLIMGAICGVILSSALKSTWNKYRAVAPHPENVGLTKKLAQLTQLLAQQKSSIEKASNGLTSLDRMVDEFETRCLRKLRSLHQQHYAG